MGVSDGEGATVEAMGARFGAAQSSAVEQPWDRGVVVPWLAREPGAPAPGAPCPLLRAGTRGEGVRALRVAFDPFNPGVIDGIFGPHPLAAVTAFQRSERLVVDGELGPQTRGALGL